MFSRVELSSRCLHVHFREVSGAEHFCKLFTGLVIIGCTNNVPAPSLFSNSSKTYEMFFNLLLARKNTLFTGPYKKKTPKTNSLFNNLNTSRALWLSWKLCDFGSRGTRFEFHVHRSQLFISVSLFFLKVGTSKNFKVFHMNGDGLRTCAPVKSIKTSQQVFIGFKNLPAGFYRELKTSGQSMCSNGRLAIEASIKNLIALNASRSEIIVYLEFFPRAVPDQRQCRPRFSISGSNLTIVLYEGSIFISTLLRGY